MAIVFVFGLNSSAGAQEVPVWKMADLQKAMDTATVPTVFNFWATFCKPCIAELPHFQAAANRYKAEGLRVVLVSLDLREAYPKTVTAFVKKHKLTAPVVFLDETAADLFIPLVDSTWSGAIPASLFLYPPTQYRQFIEEELSREKLEGEIRKMFATKKEED